jgi:prolyl-tRNA synthetase
MKLSNFFVPTLKEEPSDTVITSHKLMIRTGMIRQLTAGVYSYLPLGLLIFRKIEKIVREEMNAIGGNEFYLPALSPNELWHQTGRLEDYGDDMFRIKNRELVLAPTHEEVFTSIAKPNLISYKDLPRMWYQIQTKFRNEARPRGGVLRSRQFTMMDAYSFDSTWEGLNESYKNQDKAYRNIFTRCGLKFFVVSAFSGAMGGSESEEFMVDTESGEDSIAISEDGNYASNLEVAVSYIEPVKRLNTNKNFEKLHTPNIKTIDELADFLGFKDKSRLAKSRVFVNVIKKNDGNDRNEFILVLVCGDDEVNESKLKNIFGIGVRPARPEELSTITGADAGSIGPIDLKTDNIRIIADNRLKDTDELISGANIDGYHYKNLDLKRDVPKIEYHDLRTVKEGEDTQDRTSKIRITRAIEVGHIFKLGKRYAEALQAKFLDRDGKENTIIMGSYGIGIERIAAAFIEQNYDKDGIIWKGEITPFKVHIVGVNIKSENVKKLSEEIYETLNKNSIEVLFDDRDDLSPGFKFKDADLIGVPIQIIISEKNLKNNEIEIKFRSDNKRIKVGIKNYMNSLTELINSI